MRRRDFIRAIAYSTTALPFTALAQQSGRSRLIGVLINGRESDPETQASLVAFKQALERLNWVDGGNTRFDIRFTEDLDQMRRLAKEVVATQPDVIVAHTTLFVAAAQRETSTIPIVFVWVSDPVGLGFVASLALAAVRGEHRWKVAGNAQGDRAANEARRFHRKPQSPSL